MMRCLGEAPDNLVFEVDVRPGRPPLVRYSAEGRLIPHEHRWGTSRER